MAQRFDAELSASLLAFSGEAVVYCHGISDMIAREYAMDYTRMLRSRAMGRQADLPQGPVELFEPQRNLIRSILGRMWQKHFQQ